MSETNQKEKTQLSFSPLTSLNKDTLINFFQRKWVKRIVPIFFITRMLSVDIAGVVTNDSIHYLLSAKNPFSNGFIFQGYRQAAYPIWIRISDFISGIFGWDTIFGVAFFQRLLLGIGVILVWRALNWWAIPLLFYITSETLVGHVNFILTEGLLIAIGVLVSALTIILAKFPIESEKKIRGLLSTLVGLVFLMASIKMQYAALFSLVLGGAWASVTIQKISKKAILFIVGSGVSLVLILALFQSIENKRELDVFTPVGEQARAEWYGAWQAVFGVDQSNREDPKLQRFYAGGNLYTFLHGIEREVPEYKERAELIDERINDMFLQANTTKTREHFASFWGALKGGRTDDLIGTVNWTLEAKPHTPEIRYSGNYLARSNGSQELLNRLNDGRTPEILTVGVLFDWLQLGIDNFSPHPVKTTVNLGSLLIIFIGLLFPGRHRILSLGALTTIFFMAGLLSTAYIDNGRYLVVATIINISVASFAIQEVFGLLWKRRLDASNI